VQQGERVIDVGACEGLFSLLAAKRWPESSVIAVEPGQRMYSSLQATIRLNQMSRVIRAENWLLGSVSGKVRFFEDAGDPANSRILSEGESPGATATRMIEGTLDDNLGLKGARIALIKMDAEGAELDILRGSVEIIRKFRPALCITTYHNRHDARDIYSWLDGLRLDYRLVTRGLSCALGPDPRPVMLFALPR
jgi:FkbM family methyltransferase